MEAARTVAYAIGLDLGGTTLKGGIVSSDGSLRCSTTAPSRLRSEPDRLVDLLAAQVATLCQYADQEGLAVGCIGLSSTIDVERDTGRFKYVSQPFLQKWVGFSITNFLQTESGLPAVVAHDGFAALWGEYRVGAGRGYRSVLILTLGTGVGGGAILDDQPLPDSVGNGGASFGHMTIDLNGPLCGCGNRGCLEQYVSATALERRAAAVLAEHSIDTVLSGRPSSIEIVRAAEQGDQMALDLLEETGHYLGVGLVSLANLFNPQTVIIGGGLALAGELLLRSARDMLDRLRLPLRKTVLLKTAELGTHCGVVGAALLALEGQQVMRKER